MDGQIDGELRGMGCEIDSWIDRYLYIAVIPIYIYITINIYVL